MKRSLIRRGLAVVFAGLVVGGLTAGPAVASSSGSHSHRHQLVLTGGWSDPGPTIVSATPQGDKYLVDMTGSTVTTGGFAGNSTYTLQVLFDPVTFVSTGHARETFTATIGRRGRGHVVIAERVNVKTDGSEVVEGHIVSGDGVFRGAHGFIRYVGQTDPSGSNPATGTYRFWIDLAHHR